MPTERTSQSALPNEVVERAIAMLEANGVDPARSIERGEHGRVYVPVAGEPGAYWILDAKNVWTLKRPNDPRLGRPLNRKERRAKQAALKKAKFTSARVMFERRDADVARDVIGPFAGMNQNRGKR